MTGDILRLLLLVLQLGFVALLYLVLLRFAVGGVIFAHGVQHVFGLWGGVGLPGLSTALTGFGFRNVNILVWVTALTELVGGAAVVLGLLTPLAASGLVDGITTNPSLIARSGRDFKEVVKEICGIVEGPVSAEVTALEADGMISEGKAFTIAPAYQVEGRTIHSAVYGPAGCASCGAHSIRVDREGNIWLGTQRGINRLTPQRGTSLGQGILASLNTIAADNESSPPAGSDATPGEDTEAAKSDVS